MSVCRRKFEDTLADLLSPNGSKIFVLSRLFLDNIFPRGDQIQPLTDEHLFKIAASIRVNTTLECFHLGTIDDPFSLDSLAWTQEGITAIGEALKDHPVINKINIDIRLTNSRSIPSSQLIGLLKALTGKAVIKDLHIRVNVTQDDFLNELAVALSANTTLEKLKLERDNAVTRYPVEHCQKFAESLINKKLLHLELHSIWLGDTKMKAIAPILGKVCTLEQLEITSCYITNESADALSAMLRNYKKLRILTLDIRYGFEGSQRPGLINLITIPSLRQLSVFAPKLTEDEISIISNPKLCKLRHYCLLPPYEQSDASVEQLAKKMSANPYLLRMGRLNNHKTFIDNEGRQDLMRQQCVDYLIILASIFNEIPGLSGINLVFLPNEIKLIILKEILPVFLDISLQATWNLLFKNFNNRRTKIKNGEYVPKTNENDSNINSWWHKDRLFKARSVRAQLQQPDAETAIAIQDELSGVSLNWITRNIPQP